MPKWIVTAHCKSIEGDWDYVQVSFGPFDSATAARAWADIIPSRIKEAWPDSRYSVAQLVTPESVQP